MLTYSVNMEHMKNAIVSKFLDYTELLTFKVRI